MRFESADIQNEYKKCPELKPEDVSQFQDWAEKQPHLPKISELQAILFLQCCYFRQEAAKTAIDNFFTVRTLCYDIFGNRNPLKNPSVIDASNIMTMSVLPKLTPEGYIAFYLKFMNRDPSKFTLDKQIRAFDMAMLYHLNTEGTNNGVQIIFDMDGMSFGHFTKLGIMTLKKFFFYFQEAMPIRIKGIHFVNVAPFIDKLLTLIKPFLKKELVSVIFVHVDNSGIYKYIPQSCMPQEFGGASDSIPALHEKYKLIIKENAEFFKYEDQQLVDESKRPGKAKNEGDLFGIEGTFKKLQVD